MSTCHLFEALLFCFSLHVSSQPLVKGQAGEKERFQEMSKKNGLKDPEWAFTTAIGIAKALEKAVPATAGNKGIIMGLYE